MNGRTAKKLRRIATKEIKFDLNELDKLLGSKNPYERFKIALKILFKYKIYKK